MERIRETQPDLRRIIEEAGAKRIGIAEMVLLLTEEHNFTEEGALRHIDDELSRGSLSLDETLVFDISA